MAPILQFFHVEELELGGYKWQVRGQTDFWAQSFEIYGYLPLETRNLVDKV